MNQPMIVWSMIAGVLLLTFVFRAIGFMLATDASAQKTSKVKVADTSGMPVPEAHKLVQSCKCGGMFLSLPQSK